MVAWATWAWGKRDRRRSCLRDGMVRNPFLLVVEWMRSWVSVIEDDKGLETRQGDIVRLSG